MPSVFEPVAHARENAPWADCGDPRDPEFGLVFAMPAANVALALTFDRAARRHAVTIFDGAALGPEIVIHGRRFSVVRLGAKGGR
jgi:hypothetical protein